MAFCITQTCNFLLQRLQLRQQGLRLLVCLFQLRRPLFQLLYALFLRMNLCGQLFPSRVLRLIRLPFRLYQISRAARLLQSLRLRLHRRPLRLQLLQLLSGCVPFIPRLLLSLRLDHRFNCGGSRRAQLHKLLLQLPASLLVIAILFAHPC